MSCKNCGIDMYKDGHCDACGWRIGWMPVAQSSDGTSTFVMEPRHKFQAVAVLLVTVIGAIAFIVGVSGNGVAGIFLGPLMIIAGIVAWKKTRLGKVWQGLPSEDKWAALPGLLAGGAIAIMIIPITIIIFAVFSMLPRWDQL